MDVLVKEHVFRAAAWPPHMDYDGVETGRSSASTRLVDRLADEVDPEHVVAPRGEMDAHTTRAAHEFDGGPVAPLEQ